MHKLTHFRLCPISRSIRIVLDELDIPFELADEQPWQLRAAFLSLNPAGDLPVLEITNGPILCGSYAISEYIAEEMKRHPRDGLAVPLFPGSREDRAEVRRLVDWFHGKCHREVTRELLQEKVYSQMQSGGSRQPNADMMRAVRANLRYHLSYVSYLTYGRRWLAGEDLSFADLAAAAHLSTVDYLGEVPWDEYPVVKEYYVRLKSRPSFRNILADRVPGAPTPSHYADLDF